MSAWFVVAVFVVVYVLIATERVNRAAAAIGGAAIVVAVGIVGADEAFYSHDTGVDWNVIFLLLGMMIIVGVLRQTGVFEFLAIWAAKRARGKPYGVMALLCAVTAIASAGLDNVTTVLLIAPVTLLVCERLGVNPVPYLISEALASNIGGTSTLVGDPPNIIIASRGGLTFNDFLVNLAPFIVFLMLVFIAMCRLLFRKTFVTDPERVKAVMQLNEKEAIADPRLLLRSLIVLGLVMVAFVLHPVLGLEPSVVALLGAALLILVSGLSPTTYLAEVEWETLVFFAGLFILVGSLVEVGVIDTVANALVEATSGKPTLSMILLLGGSAVFSGVVDNIPYVATMAPVVSDLVRAEGGGNGGHVLWWALALGADLGGNATAIGASANVVILGIAKRHGHPISFWQFTRYGIVVMVVTVGLSIPYLWLRYL